MKRPSVPRRAERSLRALLPVAATALWLLPAGGALATGCFPSAALQPRLIPAALAGDASVELTFLGHSTFLIESRGGTTAVTDYNGYIRAPVTPDIVTMNNAHGTHFTDFVEPGVDHVLRGWNPATKVASPWTSSPAAARTAKRASYSAPRGASVSFQRELIA